MKKNRRADWTWQEQCPPPLQHRASQMKIYMAWRRQQTFTARRRPLVTQTLVEHSAHVDTHTRTHVKTHAHTSREGAAFSWILISLWWGAKEKWRDGIHNNKKWSDDRSILFSRHLIRLCQPLGLLFSTGIAGKTLGLTQGNPKLSLRRLHSACSNR